MNDIDSQAAVVAAKPEPLSQAQARGLTTLIEFINRRGYPPTTEELAEALGYRKKESAGYILDKLAALGRIERDPSTARGLRIIRDVEGDPVRFGISSQAVTA